MNGDDELRIVGGHHHSNAATADQPLEQRVASRILSGLRRIGHDRLHVDNRDPLEPHAVPGVSAEPKAAHVLAHLRQAPLPEGIQQPGADRAAEL